MLFLLKPLFQLHTISLFTYEVLNKVRLRHSFFVR
nr:MAG TPA: hypothetical protein [Caudoviricetes sp.]